MWDEAIGGIDSEVGDPGNVGRPVGSNVTVFNEGKNISSKVIVESSSTFSSEEGDE